MSVQREVAFFLPFPLCCDLVGDTRGTGSCIARGRVAGNVCQPSPDAVLTESVKAFHSSPLKSKDTAGEEIPAHLKHQCHSEAQCRVGPSTAASAAASAPAVTSSLIHHKALANGG